MPYFLAAGALVLVGITILNRTAIAAQLRSWHIVPESQNVTELYFNDEKSLPVGVNIGESVPVEFVVHNAENRSLTYRYTVRAAADQTSSQVLAAGTLALGHDQARTTREVVQVPGLAPRVVVSVELEYESPMFGNGESQPRHQKVQYITKIRGVAG